MTDLYKPWGPLHWLIPKLGGDQWCLLGVLGTEDRCSASLAALQGRLQLSRFLKILDPYPSPVSAFFERLDVMQNMMLDNGADKRSFIEVDLLQDIDTMEEKLRLFLDISGPDIILDITSMPKWWFFPAIRFLLGDNRVRNLIVTYASATSYSDQLSSDPAQLAPLPTFDGPRDTDRYEEVIVGVGFAPLGLRDLFEMDVGKIRFIFPFPPGPPNYFRNWGFLRTLEAEVANRDMRADDKWSVHMYDVPSMFEAMKIFTRSGDKTSALAPFGPKTSSLAMCIFAIAAEQANKNPVHVYYTQPRRYAIDYTKGVKFLNGQPDIKAYCLRLGGKDLYQL